MIAPLFGSITRPLLSPLVSGLRDELFGAFTPRSLFNDGSIGVLYDNNDFVEPTTWRRNLLTYSEQFDNAAWTKSDAAVTANTSVAPDGTTSADRITALSSGTYHYVQRNYSTTGPIVYSVYVKRVNNDWVWFSFPDNANLNTFNLATGLFGTVVAGVTATATSVGSGWYRISLSFTAVASGAVSVGIGGATGSPFFTAAGTEAVDAWGAQLEVGSTATAYQRITNFNSDFLAAFPNTTMFLDAAGTTPATVNGLVGLQLDKSQGLVLGAELIANTDFSSDTWWTKGADWVISGGTASRGTSATFSNLSRSALLTIGKFYRIELDIVAISGTVNVLCGGASSQAFTTTGRKIMTMLCAGDTAFYIQAVGSGTTCTIDNVSVKELPGNHRYQTTTGSKPILRGTPTGANLVTNGDFASGTGWTVNSGWAIGSGTLNATAVTAGYGKAVFAGATITAGKVYRITFTITARTAGGVGVALGAGASYTVGTARTAVGTYVEYITAGFNGAVEFERRSADFTGSIDNVEVVDVSAGSVTAPYGLQYDGVDDFLQTSSVNFSATDKMFVCAGVRKLSDAASASFVELSASNALNIGSFVLWAPLGAAATFAASLSGNNSGSLTNTGYETAASFPAPITRVFAAIFDIAGATRADEVVPRVNGSISLGSGLGSANAGTGNFGNYAIYFGRRGGTSLPFNGLDFGFVIVGKALTAAQIASTERWMAQRTGVSI